MGVNGVNNANTDLSIYKKLNTQQSSTTSKPSYMTKEGSLWDAPGVRTMYGSSNTQTTATVHSKNRQSEKPSTSVATRTGSTSDPEQVGNELASGKSASEGRAAAKDAKAQQAGVRSSSAESESNTSTANNFSANSQEISQDAKKANQKFKSDSQKQNSTIKQTNSQIALLSQSISAEQVELDSMNKELNSLLNADKTGFGSNSAFSLSLAGSENSGGVNSGNDDMARIQDLQTRIGEKSNVIKLYNNNVVVLTKQSSASLRSLERVNTQYVKSNQQTQKAVQSNQAQVSGFMKVANKASEIATTVTNVGTTVKYAGMAFIAMGGIPIIGAALASAGHVMKPIGEATEAIGQYGQCAANAMLAAGNIAEGNFVAALGNITTAVQTGASAVQTTKSLKSEYLNTSKQAEAVTAKANESVAGAEETANKVNSADAGNTVDGAGAPSNTQQGAGVQQDSAVGNPQTTDVGSKQPPKVTEQKVSLGNMADKSAISTKSLDTSQINKAMGSALKKSALKAEAKAMIKTLQSDFNKIKSALAAFAPSASSKSSAGSTTKAPKVRTLTSAEVRRYVEMRKSGVDKNSALRVIYGADYDNFIATKKSGSKKAA